MATTRASLRNTEELAMRRPSLLLILAIGLGLVVGACASPVSAPTVAADDQAPTPTEATDGSDATDAPDPTDAGGGGGEGEGGAPALADGPWTGGQGRVIVSGGVDWTVDEPITADRSETTEGKTQLAFNSDDTYVTIWINLIGVPFGASVTAPGFNARGTDQCDVTYSRADDSGIEATFSCAVDEFQSRGMDNPPSDTSSMVIEGTISASR
jgi:hypothetical protein